MPPTFLYMMALALWVGLAVLVWLLAAFLFVMPRTRSRARSLGLAMATTFPSVLLFQVVAAPVALGVLLVAWLVWKVLEPNHSANTENTAVIAISIIAVVVALLVVAGMSSLGFYEGWRAGWLRANGRGWRETIEQGPSARLIRRLIHWRRATLRERGS